MPVPGEHPIPHARRLHDRGVALLPVWAVEYSVLRQPARAFVSAMRAGPDPKVAGANPSPNPIPNPNPNPNPPHLVVAPVALVVVLHARHLPKVLEVPG